MHARDEYGDIFPRSRRNLIPPAITDVHYAAVEIQKRYGLSNGEIARVLRLQATAHDALEARCHPHEPKEDK